MDYYDSLAVHVKYHDAIQPAFYLLKLFLQVPEALSSGAQLDEKTSTGNPFDGNRKYLVV